MLFRSEMKKLPIARIKIENRPFIRIISECGGIEYSIIVQDGETVALYDKNHIIHTNKLTIGSKILVYPWGNATHLGNVVDEFVEEK